ncbi:hypothetical protein BVC80_8183g9 [Macleaya cordata]|uniref:Uncharacterized protein n=1 Tax=Macleaya cordata TaxID=56857 RepID=A0A200QG50_MACCD|nr:hypothetical protein BVC80_8183g9 [Macleaya cordata]
MKEKTDKAIEESSSSIYSTGVDDIFSQVMGPDSRGRRRCFGRATFSGESSNSSSNRENVEVTTLKRKVVDVEDELKNTKQQCSDLQTTTEQLRASLNTAMDELTMMRGYFRMFFANGHPSPPTQVPRSASTSSPSSATRSNHQ